MPPPQALDEVLAEPVELLPDPGAADGDDPVRRSGAGVADRLGQGHPEVDGLAGLDQAVVLLDVLAVPLGVEADLGHLRGPVGLVDHPQVGAVAALVDAVLAERHRHPRGRLVGPVRVGGGATGERREQHHAEQEVKEATRHRSSVHTGARAVPVPSRSLRARSVAVLPRRLLRPAADLDGQPRHRAAGLGRGWLLRSRRHRGLGVPDRERPAGDRARPAGGPVRPAPGAAGGRDRPRGRRWR